MLNNRRSLLLCASDVCGGAGGAPVVLKLVVLRPLHPRVVRVLPRTPPRVPEDLPLAVPLDLPAAAALRR